MKKIIAILMLMPLAVFGQTKMSKFFSVSTGLPYPVFDAKTRLYKTIDDKIVMVKTPDKNEILVQVYNPATGKEIVRKSHPYFEKNETLEDLVIFNNKLYLMFSRWDRPNTAEQLFCKEINISNGNFLKEKLLVKVDGKISRKGWRDFAKFYFYSSFDEKTLLVQYRKRPENVRDKVNKDIIGFSVFKDDFEMVWSDEVQMPYTEAEMDNADYQVDKNGTVYLLASLENKGLLLVYTKDGQTEVDLSKNEEDLINPIIAEGPDGTLYLAGLYGSMGKKRVEGVEGVFMAKLDDKHQPENYVYQKIPKNVLTIGESDKGSKKIEKNEAKGKSWFKNLKIKEITINEDKSIVYYLENYFITEKISYDKDGNMRITIIYNSREEFLIKINEKGELAWVHKLPKYQSSTFPALVGSKYFFRNGKHFTIFVDNPKNVDLPLNAQPAHHRVMYKGGFMMAYIVDHETGNLQKEFLFDMNKIPSKTEKPIAAYQFNIGRISETPKGFAFEVYKKKKEDIMIHVDFK